MPTPTSFGRLDVHLTADLKAPSGKPEPDVPFRILILGDFSGKGNRQVSAKVLPLAERKPLRVDRDNFNEVLRRLGVELHTSLTRESGPHLSIRFAELEDFHPDSVVERLALFQALLGLRRKLNAPDTFEAAAAEVRSLFGLKPQSDTAAPSEEPSVARPAPVSPVTTGSGSLLDKMLDETQSHLQQAERVRGAEEWQAFLQDLVAPHLVPGTHPKQAELVAQVDMGISQLMRAILHHVDFQALEATWRGLWFLIQRLEADGDLQVYILDVSKPELAADVCAAEDLRSSGLYQLLVEQTVETLGAAPWAAVGGDYVFDRTKEDTDLLGRIAKIARQAGAPFLTEAKPTVVGCQTFAETPHPRDWHSDANLEEANRWEELRALPEATSLGLVLPRFLLRLPYGQDTEPVSRFAFVELDEHSGHDAYLWGNPMLALVCLLGQAFTEAGWNLHPGRFQDIEGLPLHVYKADGESGIKPCAEVLLTEQAAERILDNGLMPIVSMKDRDSIRLVRFQSLAKPPRPLMGRWS